MSGTDECLDAMIAVDKARTMAAIATVIRTVASPRGYDRFLMFSTAVRQDNDENRIYWFEGNWLNGDVVDATAYLRHCPVTHHAFDNDEPFFWTKQISSQGERYRIVDSPRGEGIHGLQVPVFGRTGLEGALSFGGTQINTSARTRLLLTEVGAHAFRAARRLMTPEPKSSNTRLTSREREVLSWVAAGRRLADIAGIMGLSERTVENHLRHARKRLGVATTAHAVRTALLNGDIHE
jgi:LuxR family transcriptional regulator, quorum-sensing system regulator BjaR1